jgi:transcriptional regulator with XRE-family HTH domain
MDESFGQILGRLLDNADVKPADLARNINISKGYLSDLLNDKKPPPSDQIIIDIARILTITPKILFQAANRVEPELAEYFIEKPEAADFFRFARERNFNEDDWENLKQISKFSRLGQDESDKK